MEIYFPSGEIFPSQLQKFTVMKQHAFSFTNREGLFQSFMAGNEMAIGEKSPL